MLKITLSSNSAIFFIPFTKNNVSLHSSKVPKLKMRFQPFLEAYLLQMCFIMRLRSEIATVFPQMIFAN